MRSNAKHDFFRCIDVMRGSIPTLVFCILTVPGASAQLPPPAAPPALERIFSAGGSISMRLASGTYTIRPGSDAKIRIGWETRKPEQWNRVKTELEVQGADATLVIQAPRRSGLRAFIELPARTNLHVRLRAGDLEIRGIDGNKDIASRAGDIFIETGSAADYGRADASVRAGDIEGPPFGVSKGGLFRSFRWEGKGKYALHVHLGAGSITFLGTR